MDDVLEPEALYGIDSSITPPDSRAPSPTSINFGAYAKSNAAQTDDIGDVVAGLFLSEEYSDMRITCGDRVFSAHKNIVCRQSEFFAAALRGGFRVGFRTITVGFIEPD